MFIDDEHLQCSHLGTNLTKCLCRSSRYELHSCSSPDCLRCLTSGGIPEGLGAAMTELEENNLSAGAAFPGQLV